MGTDLAIVRSLLMQVLLAGYQWQVIFMNSLSSLIGFWGIKTVCKFYHNISLQKLLHVERHIFQPVWEEANTAALPEKRFISSHYRLLLVLGLTLLSALR